VDGAVAVGAAVVAVVVAVVVVVADFKCECACAVALVIYVVERNAGVIERMKNGCGIVLVRCLGAWGAAVVVG
jgi:hypothetical protein